MTDTKSPTSGSQSVLELLQKAKTESDRRNYAAKHSLLREAIKDREGEFAVDSRKANIIGLTHTPTGFRMHAKANAVPSTLQTLLKTSEDYLWKNIGSQVAALSKEASEDFNRLKTWLSADPSRGDYAWFCPASKQVCSLTKEACPNFESTPLSEDNLPPDFDSKNWILVKSADALRPLFSALNLVPNKLNRLIGGPTPLAGAITGGLLGAGLGYGGGYLAEKLIGNDILEKGKLRRTAAILGGLMGAGPGAYLGTVGMRMPRPEGESPWRAWTQPNPLFGEEGKTPASFDEAREDLDDVLGDLKLDDKYSKAADDAGSMYLRNIDVDAFGRTIWADPTTPVNIRAAATGLVEAASQSIGGANLISPFDLGRIAFGAGSGLVSGMLVGKVLGGLAGLTPQYQDKLKNMGLWAGALSNIIPRAFGMG